MADTPTATPAPKQPGPLMPHREKPEPVAPRVAAPAAPKREEIKPEHMKFSLWRPFRYVGAFIGGTIYDFFDNMADRGRRGMGIGFLLGAVAWMSQATIAPAALTSLVAATGLLVPGSIIATFGMCIVAGALVGIALGGLEGLLTGGIHGVGRSYRKEKYADELATREDMRRAAEVRGPSYRDIQARNQVATNYNYDRMQQTVHENQRDDAHYWRDRIDHQHNHMGPHGHGF